MRILYVEDNPTNLMLVRRVARQHDLISYIDGEEALAKFDQDKPDLVLMDLQLAGKLNGLEVVQTLRQRGYAGPIIAVTAYAMMGDRERCLEAGCDDYIAKPLPIPRLVSLFEHYDQALSAPQETQAPEESSPASVAPQTPTPVEPQSATESADEPASEPEKPQQAPAPTASADEPASVPEAPLKPAAPLKIDEELSSVVILPEPTFVRPVDPVTPKYAASPSNSEKDEARPED